jgi:hypothetical protein
LASGEFRSFDFSDWKFVADSSSFSFAGSEAGEQELALRFSAEIFMDGFLQIHDFVA